MTQMESPKRKMQRKNDYQRHKLFRKIKRRRKAQAKADQQVAMKQLRKKLKLPKFGDGKGIKSETGAPLEVKDGMLYYKETGEPFYSAGLLLPEVEIIGDKSKANPWAAAGRHNTSSYWDPNGVVHGFDKSVEAAINYPAMIMKQNGYDASGYYDKVSKIGKAMTTLSPTRWIGTLLENKMYPQLLQFHNSGKDIHIKKSKRGTFTKAAKQHGMSVQGFANRVLRNPSKYSAAMRKKANFARNASKWNK